MQKLKRNNCLNCEKECDRPYQLYCSNKCQILFQRKEKVDNGVASHSCRKNYLIETRGRGCEICGITEWCGKSVPLVMDHKDGNSENNCIENLRLVCGNCDMQLPTYKSKNRGKGRFSRRLRYEQGKSY